MSKFVNYNSAECQVLKEVFETMPMMDTYVANIVEEYIYSTVKEYFPDGTLKTDYFTKYGEIHGEYKEWYFNGQLKKQATYVDGEIEGICKYYYGDGSIEEIDYFYEGLGYSSDQLKYIVIHKINKGETKFALRNIHEFLQELNECIDIEDEIYD